MHTYLVKIGLNSRPTPAELAALQEAGWRVEDDGHTAVLQLQAASGGAAARVAPNAVPPPVRHLTTPPTAIT